MKRNRVLQNYIDVHLDVYEHRAACGERQILFVQELQGLGFTLNRQIFSRRLNLARQKPKTRYLQTARAAMMAVTDQADVMKQILLIEMEAIKARALKEAEKEIHILKNNIIQTVSLEHQ